METIRYISETKPLESRRSTVKKTMKELAAIVGFSPATISRVLTKNKSVNEKTRIQVEEALRKIKYTPTRVSRKKYSRKTVLVISGETSSNFHTRLFAVMSAMLRAQGYIVLVGHSEFNESLEELYVEYGQVQEYCGLIMITPMDTPSLVHLLEKSPCPVVLVNRYLRSIDLDSVYMDNYRAGYMVGKYLHDMGHRRIACLATSHKSTAIVDRIAGFIDAMNDAGIDANDYLVWKEGSLTSESGHVFGEQFLSNPRNYSAVFCLSEPMARGFVDTIQEKGHRIPEDVSLICVAPMPVNITGNVKLTCVIHNAEQIGKTAVEMLFDRLRGLDQAPRKIVFPPQLSIQDSVRRL